MIKTAMLFLLGKTQHSESQPLIDSFLSFFFFNLFLAALGLLCCAQAFSSCGERGLLFVAVRGLLIVVASLVAELWL